MNCQGFNEPEFVGKIRVERRKKAQKPRIEKLRRDRINGSLNEIKNLVLEALNKDVSHYSKMEKADILEMAVHFLRGAHARSRMQGGLQSGVQHFSALRDIDCKQRHLPSVPRNPRLTEDQLLERVDPDILTPPVKPMPMLHYALSPFASAPMVTMAAQPSKVWLPYPSPPPSPASQVNGVNDMELKQTPTQSRNGSSSIRLGDRPHIQLTRSSNRTLPLWRPW